MNRTSHIMKILTDIQTEFKNEFGLELSIDEIEHVVDTEFHFVHSNMVKGEATELPFIGKVTTHEAKRAPRKLEVKHKEERRERIKQLNESILTDAPLDFRTLQQVQA